MALMLKNPPVSVGDVKRRGFDPWVGKIPWRQKWLPTLVFLPGESHGQKKLAGYSLQGCKQSDTTEQLLFLLSSYGIANMPTFDLC